ncbi:MAG: DUF1573 domain-containing protein [Saprospiraceae bacterium]|nr:DUF1573 domain-containing protein [Saprospiraceae bacterium]
MLTRFNLSVLVAVVGIFVASCANDNSVRESALANVSPTATPVEPTVSADGSVQPVQPAAPVGPTTSMTFAETTFDFGTVKDGEKVRHVYKFKNTGKEQLVISNAKGSCGCTVPQWPQAPIAPGGSGEIIVEFDSKGKPGLQTKTVTITANTEPAVSTLTITGTVEGGAAAPVQ